MDKFKFIGALFFGLIATFFEKYGTVLSLVCCAVALDVITGLLRARATGAGWNSEAAQRGLWKKIITLAALLFGVFLDAFVPVLLSVVTIKLPFNLPFGLIVGCYIILNEAISICENIYESNPGLIPAWLKDFLTKAKDSIDKGDGK